MSGQLSINVNNGVQRSASAIPVFTPQRSQRRRMRLIGRMRLLRTEHLSIWQYASTIFRIVIQTSPIFSPAVKPWYVS